MTYDTSVYFDQNGNELVVAPGGKITVQPGGSIGANQYTPILQPTNGGFDALTFSKLLPLRHLA